MTEDEYYQALVAAGLRRAHEADETNPLAEYWVYGHGVYISVTRPEHLRPDHREAVVNRILECIDRVINGPH